MKKTVLGAAVLMLAACGGETKDPTNPTTVTSASATPADSAPVASASATVAPPPKPPLAELMKKTSAAMMGAWAAHDVKKLMPTYSDDAVLSMPGPMGWMDAKKADIETSMGGLFAAFPDSQMTATRTFVKGNVAVTESVFTGTNTGDFMGQKATGKKVGYHAVMVNWFNDDGLVSKEHVYYDHVTAMSQMGKGDPKAKFRAVEAMPTATASVIVAKDSPDEAKTVDAVKTWYTAFEKKDDKAFLAPFADDVVHMDYTQPADFKGKDGAKKEWAELFKTFPDAKIAPTNVWAFDTFVVAELGMTATMKGAMGPIKATNKSGTIHMLDVFEMKDGKVKAVASYGSLAEAAFAFGVTPPPGPKDAPPKDGPKDGAPKTAPTAAPKPATTGAPAPMPAPTAAPKK